MFNSLDKALTDRMIRYVMQLASELKAREAPAGTYPKTAEGRKAKRLFDIYGRDAADLKALQAKLIRDHADQDLVDQMARRKAAKPPKKVIDLSFEVAASDQALKLLQEARNAKTEIGWKNDAHAAGLEMEEFEQGPRHPPSDLTDQAALVVGENG